jgi:hypothetical protein
VWDAAKNKTYLCPPGISLQYWQPTSPSFVASMAKFVHNTTLNETQVEVFSYHQGGQATRTSESWTYTVTDDGIPVEFTYSESNPMSSSGIGINFDFEAAKMAPTQC